MYQRNLGTTTLRRRKRHTDPMQAYDALPGPLRSWLAHAALPWSPASVKRVWKRARASGCTIEEALNQLGQAEIKTLRKDKIAVTFHEKGSSHS